MGRTPTGREKRLVEELYIRHHGVWKQVKERWDELVLAGEMGVRRRSIESLQKLHKRYVRGMREGGGWTRVSLVDELFARIEPFLKRVKRLEEENRRLSLSLSKEKQEKSDLADQCENLRAQIQELREAYDPRRLALKLVRDRDVMAEHSGKHL